MKSLLVFIFICVGLLSCSGETPTSDASPVSHELWDKLLKKNVDAKGFVNYRGFQKDQAELTKYLSLLSKSAPNKTWSKDEQLAYWLNAYNAFTVQLVLDHLSEKITSIKDIGATLKIPFVNTPWDIKFIEISGKKIDLNTIEHGIIRKQFKEPRIHFALVCAAKSCPPLRNEAYQASQLNKQLDEQAKAFINDPTKNQISTKEAKISKIFFWYGSDFQKTMPIYAWINHYSTIQINEDTPLSSLDYNWQLNGSY